MSKITDSMINIPSLSKTLKQAVEDGDLSGGSIEDAMKMLAFKNWKLNATANDTTCTWSDIAYNGTTRFVAVNSGTGSSNPRTMYSSSGASWVAGPTHATERCNCICWGGTAFVRGGRDAATLAPIIHSSTDGLTWTSRTPSVTTDGAANLVAHNGTYYLIVYQTVSGSAGSRLQRLSRSPDGTTWTTKSFGVWDDEVLMNDIAVGNGIFCIVGVGYNFFLSSDGDAWQTHSNGSGMVYVEYTHVAFGNNKFVALNSSSGSLINRIAWKDANLTAGPFTEIAAANLPAEVIEWDFFNLVYAKGYWIFLSSRGVMYSKDLVTFTCVNGVIPDGTWFDAIFADNKIVVVGGSNSVNTVRSMASLDFNELT